MYQSRTRRRINAPPCDRVLAAALLSASAALLLWTVLCHRWTTDSPWMIAQGRDILENGIPYTDRFRISDNMSVVAQSWLFCVFAALFDSLGFFGNLLFEIVIVALVFAAGYLYLSRYNVRTDFKVFAVSLLILVTQYGGQPRPDAVTIVLLTAECIAFEQYRKTSKWQWLLILPAGMLLEANFHASMIWIHFLTAAAYMVPSIWRKAYLTYSRKWKAPLLFTGLMVPAMFISPYGTDGVLYLPKSLISGAFNYFTIDEMSVAPFNIALIFAIVIGMTVPVYRKRNHIPYSYQVYMVAGFFIALIPAGRNIMFMFPALLTIMPVFLRYINGWRPREKGYISELAGIALIYFLVMTVLEFPVMSNELAYGQNYTAVRESGGDSLILDADTYMKDNSDISETKLFAGFNTGGLFEYMGYENVYMDARPENRTKTMNSARDELIEYKKYCLDINAADGEIKNWLFGYDFDYLYIDKELETGLYLYAVNSNDWELIMEDEGGALYVRS